MKLGTALGDWFASVPGVGGAVRGTRSLLRARRGRQDRDREPGEGTVATLRRPVDLSRLARQPRMSLVMTIRGASPPEVRDAIGAVRRQTYPHWELCLVVDGSDHPGMAAIEADAPDDRIMVRRVRGPGGGAEAVNEGLRLASGDFIGLIGGGDLLVPDALAEVALAVNVEPDLELIYTDHDEPDPASGRTVPVRKPAWSPWYLRGTMYLGSFVMLHRDLLPRLRGWDATLDTVADHDFVLRAAEHVRHVRHLPQVLYRRGHARHAMPDSALAATQRRHAVDAHLRRLALPAAALPHPTVPGRVQIVPTPAAPRPRVSIVVSVSDRPVALRRCLATLFAKTAYDGWDVLAVERGPVRSGTEAVMREWARVRHDRFHRFRAGVERTAASALNAAVAAVTGELLVFLHDDVEVIDPGWLDQLALLASVEGVGAVGPLLLRPDGRVHHAGLAITPDGTAVPVMRGLPADGDGHEGSLCCVREVEAVTAACLMVRRRLFLETGGFDEHFATDCRDVDLCLRLRAAGFTNLFAADSRLVQRAGGARTPAADPLDRHALVDRWEHRRPLEDRYHPGDVPCYRPQPGGWRWRR